jgi:uncharacterized Tic20 family protein
MRPNEDERVLAALAHGGIIANPFNLAGVIGAALIWATQRERSAYVRGHALQSLAYQCVVFVSLGLLLFMWGACLLISLLPAAIWPDLYREGGPPDLFWLALLGALLPIAFGASATLYALYGAFRAYRGADFRYILVGSLAGSPAAPVPAPAAEPAAVALPDAPAEDATAAPPAAAVADSPAPLAPTDPADALAPTDPADALPPVEAPDQAAVGQSVPAAEADAAAPEPAQRRRTRRSPSGDAE